MRLVIAPGIVIEPDEIAERFVKSPGPGGQNVNKVATAVELRFDVAASRLPDDMKLRVAQLAGKKVGVLPGEDTLAWNLSGFARDSLYGTLLEGTVNFRPTMSVLEVVVYVAYLVPVMALFLRPARTSATPTPAAPATTAH